MGKYFNVTVKPEILVAKQDDEAFGNGDLVFDWTPFDVPKGANRLLDVTALIRKKHGILANEYGFFLLFARSINGEAPASLGTVHASAGGTGYYNNVIGKSVFLTSDYTGNQIDNMHIAGLNAGGATNDIPTVVLQGEPNSGQNVGYDTIYVACISEGNGWDFTTDVLLDDDVDVSGLSAATLTTLDTTACNLSFAPGDILRATDDIILGEVESIDANNITFKTDGSKVYHAGGRVLFTNPDGLANWKIQNGAGAAGDLTNNDEIFNLHPITLKFSFER